MQKIDRVIRPLEEMILSLHFMFTYIILFSLGSCSDLFQVDELLNKLVMFLVVEEFFISILMSDFQNSDKY